MNEVQEIGIGQALRRRLGVLATGNPAPALAPEIMPTLTVEVDRPEWYYLTNTRYAGARAAQGAGGAGTFSCASLENPAGSGVIMVLEQLDVTPGASSVLVKLSAQGVTGTPVTPTIRDSRWSVGASVGRPVGQMNTGVPVALAAENPLWWVNASTAGTLTRPVILTPGWKLRVECATANIALNNVGFLWYERTAVSGELL